VAHDPTETNDGLLALLDGCPHLESLDICLRLNVNLIGILEKRCKEQIKYLLLPYDPSDEDYPDGISDIDLLFDNDFEYYEFSDGSEFSDDNHFDF
jgi:hypothetical protein